MMVIGKNRTLIISTIFWIGLYLFIRVIPSWSRNVKDVIPISVSPAVVIADAKDIIRFSIKWTNPEQEESHYNFTLNIEGPTIMKVQDVSCNSSSLVYIGLYNDSTIKVTGFLKKKLNCNIAVNTKNEVIPGGKYKLITNLDYCNASFCFNVTNTTVISIIEKLIKPVLFVFKQSKVTGEDATIYEVNITIQHSTRSLNDAFDVEVSDLVHGMDIISINVIPKIHSISRYSGSFAKQKIIGFISHLKLNSVASVIYQTRFLRNKEAISSRSRAEIIWSNGQKNKLKFGPIYSNITCVEKHLKNKISFVENYGFIILGIILGIIIGCVVAAIIIICSRRYPSTKRYILHTDEIVGVCNAKEPVASKVFVHYDLDKDEKPKEIDKSNAFKKFVNTFKKKEVEETRNDKELPTELMWRYSLFKDDVSATSAILIDYFVHEKISLLDFTLNLWIYLWRSTLASNVNKLLKDGKIDIESRNKHFGTLVNLIKSVKTCVQKESIKDVDEFLVLTSDCVLKSFKSGIEFYYDILENVKIPRSKDALKKTRDPDVLKQIAAQEEKEEKEEKEKLKDTYMSILHEDFTNIFDKFLQTFQYISGIFLDVRLRSISSGLLLLILIKGGNFIHTWIKKTVIRTTNLLKRKRLLPDHIDKPFQEVFNDELEQLITHLLHRKEKIIETDESTALLEYLQQRASIDQSYFQVLDVFRSTLNENTVICPESTLQDPTSLQDLNEKFINAIQYTDQVKVAFDENMALTLSHSNLLASLNEALSIFYARMKTHIHDIYNNQVDAPELVNDFGSFVGDPIELQHASQINHLTVMITHLEENAVQFHDKITTVLEKNIKLINEHSIEFREIYNGLYENRKSSMFDLMSRRQILFKCVIQCLTPITWEDCIKVIETAPTFIITALCEQGPNISEYKFCDHVQMITEKKSVEMAILPISDKLDLIDNAIIEAINQVYDAVSSVQDLTKNNYNNCIQKFQKGRFYKLFQHTQRLKHQENLLNVSCKFLTDILLKIEGMDCEINEEVMEIMNNFRKALKKALKKCSSPTVTIESRKELECNISDVLKDFVSTCKVFAARVPGEVLITSFNINEMIVNIFEIGKQFKYTEDRILTASDLLNENLKLIKILLDSKALSMKQLHTHCKDLSMYLQNNEFNSVIKLMLGMESDYTLEDVFEPILGNVGDDGNQIEET